MSEQEKKQNTVAEVLVKCLENEGVKYVFGIPGEENLDMMNALEKSDIRVVVVRHEQGAAFMADMYGRLTGKAGVCFSTLGPGATNLITGTADANSDGAPLIAITGQVGTERMHLTSHQYLDLVELFAPITKRSKKIVNPNSVNEIVRIAFKYAESEKPGACHVDLPTNVAKLPVSSGIAAQPLKKPERDKEYASFSSIDQAAAMIFKAEHPVILVGHSAVRNHAGEALTSFADALKIPVVNTMMAKGIIPFNNKYSMWTIGIPQKDYQNKVLAISGDGGFMMNSQEYETALREGTPIVTLIFSDASYGLIKWKQMDHFGHNCFVDFQNPDFVKYAESMHAKGYRVERAEDLLPILEDAFQQKVPCIIDCPVDYSENTKLSEYLHEKFEK